MKILSIDTASNVCGVSILEDENLFCKLDTDTGRTHSENLMPMIEDAFSKTSLSLKDIDLLVYDKGPGSFTGIRIGIATVKAFHDSLDIPCVGVSSLEALAYFKALSFKKQENAKDMRTFQSSLVCSILDCKNDNCYFAVYEWNDGFCNELEKPTANTITTCLNFLRKYDKPITFVGDGSLVYKNEIISSFQDAIFVEGNDNILNSYLLGLAGLEHFKNNQIDDVLPLYLRKPQAQRQLEASLGKDVKNHDA